MISVATDKALLTFDASQTGDVAPVRAIGELAATNTKLDWPAGLALSESELFVLDASQAVLVYPRGASGKEAPTRSLEGSNTLLEGVSAIALDRIHHELFVGVYGSILVFPEKASGNVAPLRRLQLGGKYDMALALTIDPVHDALLVQKGGEIQTYPRAARDYASVTRILACASPNNRALAFDARREEIITMSGGLVASFRWDERVAIPVWSRQVTPVILGRLTYDEKRDEVTVVGDGRASVYAYHANQKDGTSPLRVWSSESSGNHREPTAVAVDAATGETFLLRTSTALPPAVLVFEPGSEGKSWMPARALGTLHPHSTIHEASGLGLDARQGQLVTLEGGFPGPILAQTVGPDHFPVVFYPASGTGDCSPSRELSLQFPRGLNFPILSYNEASQQILVAGSEVNGRAAVYFFSLSGELLSRIPLRLGVNDLAFDTVHSELTMSLVDGSCPTYRCEAGRFPRLVRVVRGPKSGPLAIYPRSPLALDPRTGELYVAGDEGRSVQVWLPGGNKPARILAGPRTRLRGIVKLAVEDDRLVVATDYGPNRSLLVFHRRDRGDASPVGVISGNQTLLDSIRGMRLWRPPAQS